MTGRVRIRPSRSYQEKMRRFLALLAALFLVALPATAGARSVAPPGNAGVDEYLETIPGAGGNQPPNQTPPKQGRHPALAPHVARKLARAGAAGRAVQQLVQNTAPPAATQPRHRPKPPSGKKKGGSTGPQGEQGVQGAGPVKGGGGRGLIDGILHPILTGSTTGGLGVGLPLVLLAILLATLGVVARKRAART